MTSHLTGSLASIKKGRINNPMGRLINGQWTDTSIVTSSNKGEYERVKQSFLELISDDHPQFKPESNRYHLYVSYACPWAHRTLIYRSLKSLEAHISVTVVCPDMLAHGWTFETQFPGSTGDQLYHQKYLYELYQKAAPQISTTVTVPVLWDKKEATIVNNESSQIIRIFNTAFNQITGNTDNFYPSQLQADIDQMNTLTYNAINNGVYRCGFAKTQDAYEEAVTVLFDTLQDLDTHLSTHSYLVGNQLTEADIRLVTTLLRFDPVYVTHFKCNIKRLIDFPNLYAYLNRLRELPAISSSTHLDHIKRHYFYSHHFINPYRIIPLGPKAY